MLVFKHPKFYAELRKKRKQYLKELEASHVKEAISPKPSTDGSGRAPAYVWYFHDHKWKQRYDPSAKPKVTSHKPQAPIFRKRQAQRASGGKRQAPSNKL